MDEPTELGTSLAVIEENLPATTPGTDIALMPEKPKKGRGKKADEPNAERNNRARTFKSYADRLQDLMEDKRQLAQDIADLKVGAREAGINPKALAIVVAKRMETFEQAAAREAVETEVFDIEAALGLLADTPLGAAARAAA